MPSQVSGIWTEGCIFHVYNLPFVSYIEGDEAAAVNVQLIILHGMLPYLKNLYQKSKKNEQFEYFLNLEHLLDIYHLSTNKNFIFIWNYCVTHMQKKRKEQW